MIKRKIDYTQMRYRYYIHTEAEGPGKTFKIKQEVTETQQKRTEKQTETPRMKGGHKLTGPSLQPFRKSFQTFIITGL